MDKNRDEELESLAGRVAKAMNDKQNENRYMPSIQRRENAKMWLQGIGFPAILALLFWVGSMAANIATSVKVLEGFRASDHAQIEILAEDLKVLRHDVTTISALQGRVDENSRKIDTINAQLQLTQANYMTILEKVSQLAGEIRATRPSK